MGLLYADIELLNAVDLGLQRRGQLPEDQIRRIKARVLVDSGAYMLSINEVVRRQLDLPKLGTQTAELADGSEIELDIVGPVEVRFENRHTTVEAIVLPGEADVLLGAIPIEGMDVMIDLQRQRLVVNPSHPKIAHTILK
ncbi:MAG: retroviral-like aspartic protease family protein [Chloroflexota bacterium]